MVFREKASKSLVKSNPMKSLFKKRVLTKLVSKESLCKPVSNGDPGKSFKKTCQIQPHEKSIQKKGTN